MISKEHCKVMGGKVKKDTCVVGIQNKLSTKETLQELKELYDEVTTSDLQGIAMANAIRMKIPPEKRSKAEDIMLQFAQGDRNIDNAKKSLDKLR